MACGVGLYARLLVALVARCAAVTPQAGLSHAAGAKAITAQEINGVKHSKWRPLPNPYFSSPHHRLFTAEPPLARHEIGLQKGTPRRASDKDSALIVDHASNPIAASPLTALKTAELGFWRDPGGLDDRARHRKPRIIRPLRGYRRGTGYKHIQQGITRQQATAKEHSFPHSEAISSHARDLLAGGAFGRQRSAANEISAVHQVGQSGRRLGGFPGVEKGPWTEGSAAVSPFRDKVLSSSRYSNTARIEAYGQETGPQSKSPLHAGRTDYTLISPKTVLQPLSPWTAGFLKKTSDLNSQRSLEGGKYPVIKSHPTAPISDDPVSSGTQQKQVVPIPNSSQHVLRKSQSYLFVSPPTTSVRRDSQSDNEQKSSSGHSISSSTLKHDTSPALKSHRKPPSTSYQLQLSNPESSSREARRPLNEANRPFRIVNVSQRNSDKPDYHPSRVDSNNPPINGPPHFPPRSHTGKKGHTPETSAPNQPEALTFTFGSGSDKHYVSHLPAGAQVRRSMLDFKSWRPTKTSNGTTGSTSSIQLPVDEGNEGQPAIASIRSNQRPGPQRYSLDKTMTYTIRGTNNYPVASKEYEFGQRGVPTSHPQARMEINSQGYPEPNAVGFPRANQAADMRSMSSLLFPESGAPSHSKTSADVQLFSKQHDKSKALHSPDTPLDTNTKALATPSEIKMDYINIRRALRVGNGNKGDKPDLKEYRNQRGTFGLRGSTNVPHSNSSSELREGAKASDISTSGIDKHDSLKRRKSIKFNRWFKPFSSASTREYSTTSILEGSDIPGLDGENIEAELQPKPDPFQSVPDYSRLLENGAPPDKSSSYRVSQGALTSGYSALIPRSSIALGEGTASQFEDDSPSASATFKSLPRGVSSFHPVEGEVHGNARESIFSSEARLQNVRPGSDQNGAAAIETGQPPANATFTRSLDAHRGDELETAPVTATESPERPGGELDKYHRQASTLVAQPKTARTGTESRSGYTLQTLTSPLASTGRPLADPSSAHLKAESVPSNSKLKLKPRPTSITVKGKRVRAKPLKGKNPVVATNDTSNINGSQFDPLVPMPKKRSHFKHIRYVDIVGSATFSGVHAKRRSEKAPANQQAVDKAARPAPQRNAQGGGAVTKSDPLGNTKGQRGGPAGSLRAAHSGTSEEPDTDSEELQELNYLKTSAGNASFKSAKLSRADEATSRTAQT